MSGREKHISKAMAYFLRHGADKSSLKMDEGGFVKVEDLLGLQNLKSKKTTLQDILTIVENDAKHRYALQDRDGVLYICATQGHLLKTVSDSNLQPLDEASLPKQILHGTKQSTLATIRASGGLSRMNRNHIHLTTGGDLISGFRASSNALIYIDGLRCLRDGIPFFQSSNGVVLTPGNLQGFIECKYFTQVTDRSGNSI